MSMTKAVVIDKLDGSNYNRWKFQVSLLLKANDLWDVVSGDIAKPGSSAKPEDRKDWMKKDVEAMSIISSTLDNTQINHVYDCDSSKAMFDRLKDVNSDSSSLNKQHTLMKFMSYSMDKHQSPVQAMVEIEQLARSLQEMGCGMPEEGIITKIVSSLPKQYSAFQTAWDSVSPSEQTRPNLLARLRKEELRTRSEAEKEDDEDSSSSTRAFKMDSSYRNKKWDGSKKQWESRKDGEDRESRPKGACFHCGKNGHYKRDCRSRKSQSGNAQNQSNNEKSSDNGRAFTAKIKAQEKSSVIRQKERPKKEQRKGKDTTVLAYSAKNMYSGGKTDWVSDSGATQHVCGNRDWFSEFQEFEAGEEPNVVLADNIPVKALGKGVVNLEVLMGSKWTEGKIMEVLYIPGGANLFSEIVMAQKGYTIVRDRETTKYYSKDKLLGPQAEFRDGAYIMKFRPFEETAHATVIVHRKVMEKPQTEKSQQQQQRQEEREQSVCRSKSPAPVFSPGSATVDEDDDFCLDLVDQVSATPSGSSTTVSGQSSDSWPRDRHDIIEAKEGHYKKGVYNSMVQLGQEMKVAIQKMDDFIHDLDKKIGSLEGDQESETVSTPFVKFKAKPEELTSDPGRRGMSASKSLFPWFALIFLMFLMVLAAAEDHDQRSTLGVWLTTTMSGIDHEGTQNNYQDQLKVKDARIWNAIFHINQIVQECERHQIHQDELKGKWIGQIRNLHPVQSSDGNLIMLNLVNTNQK
jgi:hypothetical protein